MISTASSEESRAAIAAARVAVAGLQHRLWQPVGADLPVLLGELDALGSAIRAATIAVTAEALSRGEVRSSHAANTVAWLREHAPSLRQGGAKALADCAELLAAQRNRDTPLWQVLTPADEPAAPEHTAGQPDGTSDEFIEQTPTHLVCRALLTGALTPPVALTVLGELDRLAARLRPETHATVTAGLIDLGAGWGSGLVRRLRPRLLADYGLPGELQADQDTLARFVTLTTPVVIDGLTTYRLTLDPLSAATVEAAIGPLSAPTPNPETGERDLRPAGRRRAEALVEVCRRATAAGDQLPGGTKTALFITVDYATLRSRIAQHTRQEEASDSTAVPVGGCSPRPSTQAPASSVEAPTSRADLRARSTGAGPSAGAGTVVGTPATGVLLAPDTIRLLACDAELIPTVLGSRSEPLDLGASIRLFSRAQTRALWLRDGGCTFPGCATPAHWCHAHHLTHWADGGPTDLNNAALLCHRHHTIVHRDRLHATVDPPGSQPRESPPTDGNSTDTPRPPGVHWDLCPGSYDQALATSAAA